LSEGLQEVDSVLKVAGTASWRFYEPFTARSHFMPGILSWRPRIIQDNFFHKLCAWSDTLLIVIYIALLKTCIKCDHTVLASVTNTVNYSNGYIKCGDISWPHETLSSSYDGFFSMETACYIDLFTRSFLYVVIYGYSCMH
jgi:hypothetical protein